MSSGLGMIDDDEGGDWEDQPVESPSGMEKGMKRENNRGRSQPEYGSALPSRPGVYPNKSSKDMARQMYGQDQRSADDYDGRTNSQGFHASNRQKIAKNNGQYNNFNHMEQQRQQQQQNNNNSQPRTAKPSTSRSNQYRTNNGSKRVGGGPGNAPYDGDSSSLVGPTNYFPDEMEQGGESNVVGPVPSNKSKQEHHRIKKQQSKVPFKPKKKVQESESSSSSDDDGTESIVPPVSQKQQEEMNQARSSYNTEQSFQVLKVELTALQSSTNNALIGLQREVQSLVMKNAELGKRLEKMSKKFKDVSDSPTEEIKQTLQTLRNNSKWFWGRVLPNNRGYIELYSHLPIDEEGRQPSIVKIPSGKRLKLSYPMRPAVDLKEKSFIWIKTESIDPLTAEITNYWAKSYNIKKKIYLIGDFKFSDDTVINTVQQLLSTVGTTTTTAAATTTIAATPSSNMMNSMPTPNTMSLSMPGGMSHSDFKSVATMGGGGGFISGGMDSIQENLSNVVVMKKEKTTMIPSANIIQDSIQQQQQQQQSDKNILSGESDV